MKTSKQKDFAEVQTAIDELSTILRKHKLPYLGAVTHPNDLKTTIFLGGSFMQMKEIVDQLIHHIFSECKVSEAGNDDSFDVSHKFSSEEKTIH
jgi:hypothetical protein